MAREQEGEGELIVVFDEVCARFGEEIPGVEVVDAPGAAGAVLCDGPFGGYGGIQGHGELGELDLACWVRHVQNQAAGEEGAGRVYC